jgi:hypothetical protein
MGVTSDTSAPLVILGRRVDRGRSRRFTFLPGNPTLVTKNYNLKQFILAA